MTLYELGVIIDSEIAPEDETATLERLEKIITDSGGTVLAKDAWGRRALAYPIKKKTHGAYQFWKIECDGQVIKDLNFELRTNDNVMRSLVLNMDRELRRKRKMDAKQAQKVAAKAAKKAAAAAADE